MSVFVWLALSGEMYSQSNLQGLVKHEAVAIPLSHYDVGGGGEFPIIFKLSQTPSSSSASFPSPGR
jgi:hypothetical protein